MGLAKEALFLFLIVAHYEVSNGAVYKVGDSAGWTITGNVDYVSWASTKTFHVGDTLIFEYDPQLHNLMRVSPADFRLCNAKSPIATHSTGNDSFTIQGPGHYYFICGFPDHCEAGQKVDIRVLKSPQTTASPDIIPSQAPTESSPEASPYGLLAPSPSQNTALSLIFSRLEIVLLVLGLWVYAHAS